MCAIHYIPEILYKDFIHVKIKIISNFIGHKKPGFSYAAFSLNITDEIIFLCGRQILIHL